MPAKQLCHPAVKKIGHSWRSGGRARICLLAGAREQTLGHLQPSSAYAAPAWVKALEATWRTSSWPIRQIKALFASGPEMALGTLREVGTMLQNTVDLIEDLAFRPVQSRLARYLVTESRQQGSNTVRLIGNTAVLGSLPGTSAPDYLNYSQPSDKARADNPRDRRHVKPLFDDCTVSLRSWGTRGRVEQECC